MRLTFSALVIAAGLAGFGASAQAAAIPAAHLFGATTGDVTKAAMSPMERRMMRREMMRKRMMRREMMRKRMMRRRMMKKM